MTAMRARRQTMKHEFGLGRLRCGLGFPRLPPCLWAAPLAAPAQRAERPVLTISGYTIDAELDTAAHHLAAKVGVTFTAPENAEVVSFGFHPAPQGGQNFRRCRQSAHRRAFGGRNHSHRSGDAVCPRPGRPLDLRIRGRHHRQRRRPRGRAEAGRHPGTNHLSALRGALVPHHRLHDQPASLPRCTFACPQGMRVFASGSLGSPHPAALATGSAGDQYDFKWTKPGFPAPSSRALCGPRPRWAPAM